MADINSSPILQIDISLPDVDLDLFAAAQSINKLAPFGMANKKPLFSASQLICEKVSPLGRNGKHHRLDLKNKQGTKSFTCLFWNTRNIIPNTGDIVDIVFNPEINVFNGKERLQLILSDWRLSNKDSSAANTTKINPATSIAPLIEVATHEPAQVNTQAASLNAPISRASVPPLNNKLENPKSSKINFIDLRHFSNAKEITTTAITKLGNSLGIFSEKTESSSSSTFDRLSLPERPHLLIQQFPPSLAVWKQIVTTSGANKIYLLGTDESENTNAAIFIKRMLGLVRYVINKKSGAVETNRIATALGTTDIASALALALLRKIDLLDWYTDDGIIYLDLLNIPAEQDIKQLNEYHQLEEVLKQIIQFRLWCKTASISEIESMISKGDNKSPLNNALEFVPEINNPVTNTLEEYAFNRQY